MHLAPKEGEAEWGLHRVDTEGTGTGRGGRKAGHRDSALRTPRNPDAPEGLEKNPGPLIEVFRRLFY